MFCAVWLGATAVSARSARSACTARGRGVHALSSVVMSVLVALVALLLSDVPGTLAGYSFKRDGVLVAGQSTFEDVVVYAGVLTVCIFYSPSCPHCVRLEPEVKEAAKQLAEVGIRVVAVDAVQERGLADYYNVTGYPTLHIFVPPEKATSHAGGEASPVPVTGIGAPGRIVQAACEQRQLLVERKLRSRPPGGSKILPDLESYDAVRALVSLQHPTTLSAKAAVLYLAGGGSPTVCGVPADEATPSWLTTAASKFKEGRAKSVSFATVPASLAATGLAEEFGLTAAELPALLFIRARSRSAARPAGVSIFRGSLNVGASQKKTALIASVKTFVEQAVRGELASVPGPVPDSLQVADATDSEDGSSQEDNHEDTLQWEPVEIDSTESLNQSCYDQPGACLLLLCLEPDRGFAAASTTVCNAARHAFVAFGRRHRHQKLSFVTLDVVKASAAAAARAAEDAATLATKANAHASPTDIEAVVGLAEQAATEGVRHFANAFVVGATRERTHQDQELSGMGLVHVLAIKTGKRPRYACLTTQTSAATAAVAHAVSAALGAWQRGVVGQYYAHHGVVKTSSDLESIWSKRQTIEATAAEYIPMSPAQFEVVCESLRKKYPPLSDGAGPVDLWRQSGHSRASQEESELLAVSAAAAATVNNLFVAVFDTAVEILAGGSARFTKLNELPTLEAAATDSGFTTPTGGGHKEL